MTMEMLAKEFVFDCQARELAPKTIRNYEKQVGYFVRYLAEVQNVRMLEELQPIHIKQYVVMLVKKKHKPSYTNDLLKAVKCLCAYAYQEGYTEELITKRVKNVREPKVLIHTFSNDEIKKMIAYYNGRSYLDVRNRLMLMLLFDTGIRVSEIINMKPEQIKEGYFVIYGKGRKERIVPQNPAVSKMMLVYDRTRADYFEFRYADEYYFLSKNGKKLTSEAVCRFMKKAAADIGVNALVRVSPHTCRHTFAHQELKNGIDLFSLSRVLGHENITITQRYLESVRDEQVLVSASKAGVLAHL